MKIASATAFPFSLALFLITAGPFSYAAPPPLPVTVAPGEIAQKFNSVPHVQTEDVNITTVHLARRGCTFSSERESWTCDGSVPPHDEIVDQMRRKGNVGKKVSAFYTLLGGPGAITLSKRWMKAHKKLIPCRPGAVMFDEIVDKGWNEAVGNAMTAAAGASRVVTFQKFISQIMAEQSSGTAWLFTPADTDFDQVRTNPREIDNTWLYWEFPALTQNTKIDKIIRTDPNDFTDPPSLTTIWTKGDPTQVPRGLPTPRPPMLA